MTRMLEEIADDASGLGVSDPTWDSRHARALIREAHALGREESRAEVERLTAERDEARKNLEAACEALRMAGKVQGKYRADRNAAEAEVARLRASPEEGRLREALIDIAGACFEDADSLRSMADAALRSPPAPPTGDEGARAVQPEAAVRCEERSGPFGQERQCLRLKDHDGRGHLFDDREIEALWFGLEYWHRKACDMEAALHPYPGPEPAEMNRRMFNEFLVGANDEVTIYRREDCLHTTTSAAPAPKEDAPRCEACGGSGQIGRCIHPNWVECSKSCSNCDACGGTGRSPDTTGGGT